MTSREKKLKLAGEVAVFAQAYSRRAQKGIEPNDRGYDRKIEQKIKQMKPDQLSNLLSGDPETETED